MRSSRTQSVRSWTKWFGAIMEDEATAYPEGTVCGEDEPTKEPGDVDDEEEDGEIENEPDAFDPSD